MVTGIWLIIGSAVVGLMAWTFDRRRRRYLDLATTPAAAVFAGRNEVKGRAWAASPLTTRRTNTACVWWTYLLEEEREHTRTVTSTDANGNTSTRTEHYTQWHEIDHDSGMLSRFEVVDDTGSVPVSVDGGRVEPRTILREVFKEHDDRPFLSKLFDFDSRTGRLRETEEGIVIGDQLFVVGEAVLDDERGVPYLTSALVSTRSEESRTGILGVAVYFLLLAAMVAVTIGSAYALTPNVETEPPLPVYAMPGLAAGLLALALAWSVITYNRLHLLSQGVERAAALIDVQLKRRHDLVPALARVVATHADHERSLLESLTAQRSTAGTDAAEQTADLRQVMAVAEDYPQLTADQSFLNLQHELADSEARIAGSRTFYNDTVTLLRDRSRRFPGVLVARFVPHAKGDLTAAEGFERTVPALTRAFS